MKKIVKETLKKDSVVYKIIANSYSLATRTYELFFYTLFTFLPINEYKIVVNNHKGKGYGDNAKYIIDELIKNDTANKLDIVWLLRKGEFINANLPSEVRYVLVNSLSHLYELATAKLWIENNRIYKNIFKRKSQFYIQTWHGGLGLKKIEGDAPYGKNKKNRKRARKDSNMTDLYISNSKHLSEIYRRAFEYKGEIAEVGYPKNDILFEEKTNFRSKVRECFQLPLDRKILLYAPTFRESKKLDAYDIDFNFLAHQLNKIDKGWSILIRLHPHVETHGFRCFFGEGIIDASNFPDMQELVLGIDTLVTDYSSCMFDSAIAGIPTFIYASDANEYIDERGTYFSLNELPFTVSYNTNELAKSILNFNHQEYQKKLKTFYSVVGLYDQGNASKLVVEIILDRIIDIRT